MEREIEIKTSQGSTSVIDLRHHKPTANDLSIRIREDTVVVPADDSIAVRVNHIAIQDLIEGLDIGVSISENSIANDRVMRSRLGKRDVSANRPKRKQSGDLEKRNIKRVEIVEQYMANFSTYSELARRTRSSYITVKDTIETYRLTVDIPQASRFYVQRREEIEDRIMVLTSDQEAPFYSCSTLKRKLDSEGRKVSKKMIAQILRKAGLRWLDIETKYRVDRYRERKYDLGELHSSLSMLSQGVLEKTLVPIFVNEFIAPLDQVPLKAWRKGKSK